MVQSLVWGEALDQRFKSNPAAILFQGGKGYRGTAS